MYRKTLVRLSLITLVAMLISSAHAQTFSVIHTFNGGDGANPLAGVTLKGGALYGTTELGPLVSNSSGYGTVYQIQHVGTNWYASDIYLFSYNDGAIPISRVVFGPDGYLYGTTLYGPNVLLGTVFSLVPSSEICRTANCFWKERALYAFTGADGMFPGAGDLIWDQQNNIYGTTEDGGSNQQGNVFQLTPSGNNWTGTSLYDFGAGNDIQRPYGGVIFDQAGNLWGTTLYGGNNNQGGIYELKYAVGVGWQESVIYRFNGATDGAGSAGALISDAAGNFYGATVDQGVNGGGTVFELSPSGNSWNYQVLYSLTGTPGNYCGPQEPLAMDASGNLYGTTYCDGANQQGNIFKLTHTVNGWQYTSLYDFTGGNDGAHPVSNVTIDTDGTLYGTASAGGSTAGYCNFFPGCGTVWMIKP
jgi:uncharacterized repeat protein (TIGR03803 family)